MTDSIGLQKLQTWLSPGFPVGGFAWSAGLETAIAEGLVTDPESTIAWIAGGLEAGSARTDAILLAHAHRCCMDAENLCELADLSVALTSAAERLEETTAMGQAFAQACAAWPETALTSLPDSCPYPVSVGAIAGVHRIELHATLAAFLTAAVHSQISVAVRLVPIGQTAGLRAVVALEPDVAQLAEFAAEASLQDIGGIAYTADIAQMRHEQLQPRLFRS